MKEAFEAVASSLPPEKIADDARDSL